MTRRRDEDHYGQRAPSPAAQLAGTMFDAEPTPPHWTQRWASMSEEERRAQRSRWQEKLLPLVLQLAARRDPEGITASEVLSAGITTGILNGERAFISQHPRIYSWIGAWLAQLARAGTIQPKTARIEGGGEIHLKRESTRDLSHGNGNLIYVRAA